MKDWIQMAKKAASRKAAQRIINRMAVITDSIDAVMANSKLPILREPVHPGEILLEDFLKPNKIAIDDFNQEIRLPREDIKNIIEGKKSITARIAILFAERFNTTPQFWLNLQMNYDLPKAAKRIQKRRKLGLNP